MTKNSEIKFKIHQLKNQIQIKINMNYHRLKLILMNQVIFLRIVQIQMED